MRTSYRDIFLLACCQALLLTNAAGLITMNGLVGYALADTKTLATLGVTTYVLGSALATMPASLWMARVGRRTGFMAGALINVAGCALAVLAHQPRQLRALLRRDRRHRHLQRDRAAVPLRGGRGGGARGQGEGDLAGAGGRHRRRLPRSRVRAPGDGPVRDAVPGRRSSCSPATRWSRSPCSRACTCRRRRSRSAPAAAGRSR